MAETQIMLDSDLVRGAPDQDPVVSVLSVVGAFVVRSAPLRTVLFAWTLAMLAIAAIIFARKAYQRVEHLRARLDALEATGLVPASTSAPQASPATSPSPPPGPSPRAAP